MGGNKIPFFPDHMVRTRLNFINHRIYNDKNEGMNGNGQKKKQGFVHGAGTFVFRGTMYLIIVSGSFFMDCFCGLLPGCHSPV